jgi:hypothetical protein
MIEQQAKDLRLDKLAQQVASLTENRVASGPFTGMRLDYDALPVHGAPKFLGTYEQELHDCLERSISLAPLQVLNVGCAEGFYAVGLARRLPDAQIYAADADPKALRATLHNAELNGVSKRVAAVGIIKSGAFSRYLGPGSLLVMDCEGAEFDLLNPDTDPILLVTHILVEIHHDVGSAKEITQRFANSHRTIHIEAKQRTISDAGRFADRINAIAAVDERASERSWLYLESALR